MKKHKNPSRQTIAARCFLGIAVLYCVFADVYLKATDVAMYVHWARPEYGFLWELGSTIMYFALSPIALLVVIILLAVLPQTAKKLNVYGYVLMYAGIANTIMATDWNQPFRVFWVVLTGIALLLAYGGVLLALFASERKRKKSRPPEGRTKEELLLEYQTCLQSGMLSPEQFEEYRRILEAADPKQRYY